MKNHTCTIYALLNKNEPFYVGRTIDLERRLREHSQDLGFRPEAKVLAIVHERCRSIKEFWKKLRADPIRYREYIDNRAAAIKAGKAKNRNKTETQLHLF